VSGRGAWRRLVAAAALGLAATAGVWGSASAALADAARPLLQDTAGLLTADQASTLEAELERVSAEYRADVVIVTIRALDARTVEAYADDYFDYGPSLEDPALPGRDVNDGYGRGADRSGVLLLVSVNPRQAHITTTGQAIDIFTDARQDEIWDAIIPSLTNDRWDSALRRFVSEVDQTYRGATRFRWEIVALAALAGGLLGGLTPVTIWRRQLKSVKPAAHARPYLQTASLVLTSSNDTFVGQSTRVIHHNESSGSGGGGSSTHSGSSGISHGGSSRSF
jgi:uncharacterized protein